MGETSGEVIAPPQAAETRENAANFGLSVNGSQLIALGNLDYLEKNGFVRPARPNIVDRLKSMGDGQKLQILNTIKTFVLEGKLDRAKDLLNQKFKFIRPPSPLEQEIKQEIIDVLSKSVSIKEAIDDNPLIDAAFRGFVQSLPGIPLNEMPGKYTSILLTQLGINASLSPETNLLHLSPTHFVQGTAHLPADQQHPLYIEEKEVFGEENTDNTISRLEVFAELAIRYPNVFTHITASSFLPKILNSGFIGRPYEKGSKGTIESERGGVYIETLSFKDAPEYTKTIQQLKSAGKITVPAEIPGISKDKLRNYPLHELLYVNPNTIAPIAIFSDQFPQKHKLSGWLADDVADIKDDCLIGILVTPQYKHHLLHWISTWTEEKRQEVFGERKPEDVLISSAKDLPPLEK